MLSASVHSNSSIDRDYLSVQAWIWDVDFLIFFIWCNHLVQMFQFGSSWCRALWTVQHDQKITNVFVFTWSSLSGICVTSQRCKSLFLEICWIPGSDWSSTQQWEIFFGLCVFKISLAFGTAMKTFKSYFEQIILQNSPTFLEDCR